MNFDNYVVVRRRSAVLWTVPPFLSLLELAGNGPEGGLKAIPSTSLVTAYTLRISEL